MALPWLTAFGNILRSLILMLPLLAVWGIGILVVLARWRDAPKPACWLGISLALLIAVTFLGICSWSLLPAMIGFDAYLPILPYANFGIALLRALCVIGVLIAIFSGRGQRQST